ncbi:hypothetical protein SAMN04244579_02683 [Azotobacter beijerinckii]|uniref:Uncharacterized protein n=1 Tax=Azotobacter beijerinckii TaxID=170623 RepID=A0A1H6VCB9_9GAMM|nr:hypothetical protein [Azotobacter beijerinckii]SEI98270.1 hypothetical protein SAMN04244579_02683 [Azotobacter beijerinckii]
MTSYRRAKRIFIARLILIDVCVITFIVAHHRAVSAGLSTGTPMTTSPRLAAQLDWMQQGEFRPERFQGEQRKEYEDERRQIERQWDNQPR